MKQSRSAGFILYSILICLIIATILALTILKITLLYQTTVKQSIRQRLIQREALDGLLQISRQNPLQLSDTWQTIPVTGHWPAEVVTQAKLQFREFLPATLNFLERNGDDIYILNVQAGSKVWHSGWWRYSALETGHHSGLSKSVVIGGYPVSHYAARLSGSPDDQATYLAFQAQQKSTAAVVYQIDLQGNLEARDRKTGKIVWQQYLIKPKPKQLAQLTAADIYANHAWHTVLLAIIGRQVWLLDVTNNERATWWWHQKFNTAQQLSGTLFRANNGQWLVMLAVSGKLSQLQVLKVTDGTVLNKTPLAADSATLSAPVVVDGRQDLIGNWAYVGDSQGRLWTIHLTGDPSHWQQAQVIFNAEDRQGVPQAILQAPLIAERDKPGFAVYVLAGNSIQSSIYGLLLRRPDQVIQRQELTRYRWPAINKTTQLKRGWVIDSEPGQYFTHMKIVDDRLWYVLSESKQLYVGAIMRNNGLPVTDGLFRNAPQQAYLTLPIRTSDSQLQFYHHPWRLEVAGNQVLLYPHPYRSGRQGLYLVK